MLIHWIGATGSGQMPPLTSDDSVHLLIDGELHPRVSSTPQSRRGNTIYAVGRETTRMIKE